MRATNSIDESATVVRPNVRIQHPTIWSVGFARTKVEIKQFFREKDALVFTFAFPVILLFIFGSVFGEDIAPGVSFSQYFVAGMIASGFILVSFQSLAIGIAVERDDGTLKRIEGTPMPRASYFVGKIGLVLVTAVLQTAILLAVGTLLFGISLPDSGGKWLTLAWVGLLGTDRGHLARYRLLECAAFGTQRGGGREPRRHRAAVHFRSVLRLQPAAHLDAARGGGVPTEVDGAGHPFGVPAGLVRDAGAQRLVAARHHRDRARRVVRRWTDPLPADIPLAAA